MRESFLAAFVVLGLLLGLRATAWAMFMLGAAAPVERLLKNTEAYVREHPDDPRGYYVLGRVHALAYCLKTDKLRQFGEPEGKAELPRLDRHEPDGREEDEKNQSPPAEQLQRHLAEAVRNYRKAIALAPEAGLYHFSLGYVLEAGTADAQAAGPLLGLGPKTEGKADWAKQMREEAIAQYWEAYRLCVMEDLKTEFLSSGDMPVAYEAAESYLRLVQERGPAEAERKRIEQAGKDLGTFRRKGGFVTPIIFSTIRACPLEELLEPAKTVRFDLDGDGVVEEWPWVKPDTCILVWDPGHTGRVTSGRQLFGSVTWWIFWRDGYHALDALDDNRDGFLSGDELRGLAVWRDANGNGVSEPGEVVPLSALGVVALSVCATERVEPGPSPACPQGLRLADGRALPTYDWVARR
jgi:tetratricopeptide (TPR) repeat protein